jgi:L-ascorbate metabolism protein UlaG (beta-lactamase superfamily)
MKVTYIRHSGFLIEWESCYFLFDYYKGTIPKLEKDKKVIVFVSHKHHDHFNPGIFDLTSDYPDVEFVLSSDISANKITHRAHVVDPGNEYSLTDTMENIILIKTLKSTDSGVAFLIEYLGKTIYYAGDLNWWLWSGESEQYNADMTEMFNQQMEVLKGSSIDLAFAPLDPRQEEYYYYGIEKLLHTASVQYIFPMHFWEKPSIIQRFKRERSDKLQGAKVMDINEEGQTWIIKI